MTTILFDPVERAIYTDSQATSGETVTSIKVNKISHYNIKGYGGCLVAMAGYAYNGHKLIEAINKGEKLEVPDENDSSYLLILDRKGVVYESRTDSQTITKYNQQTDCIVNGSGAWYARAAYLATKDPIKALEVAKEMDIYSGGKTRKALFINGLPVFEKY